VAAYGWHRERPGAWRWAAMSLILVYVYVHMRIYIQYTYRITSVDPSSEADNDINIITDIVHAVAGVLHARRVGGVRRGRETGGTQSMMWYEMWAPSRPPSLEPLSTPPWSIW